MAKHSLSLSNLDFSNPDNSPDWAVKLRQQEEEKNVKEQNALAKADAWAQAQADQGITVTDADHAKAVDNIYKTGEIGTFASTPDTPVLPLKDRPVGIFEPDAQGSKENPLPASLYDRAPVGAYVKTADGGVVQRDVTMPERAKGNVERVGNNLKAAGKHLLASAVDQIPSIDDLKNDATLLTGGIGTGNPYAVPTAVKSLDTSAAARTNTFIKSNADATREQQTANDALPLSLDRLALNKDLAKPGTVGQHLISVTKHLGAFAESTVETLAPFAALALAGPAGGGLDMAMMGGQAKADGYDGYLSSKGIDPTDFKAASEYLSDPQHMEEMQHFGDIKSAAAIGSVVTAGGLVKLANVGLDAAKVAGATRTAASVTTHVGANAGAFVAGSHAANAALGQETTGAEDAQSIAMSFVFGPPGAAREHAARIKAEDDLARRSDAQSRFHGLQEGVNNLNDAPTSTAIDVQKLNEILRQGQHEELVKKADESRKKADLAKAYPDEQAVLDQQEADHRNKVIEDAYAGQTRYEKDPNGGRRVPVEPPAGVTAEDIAAEREAVVTKADLDVHTNLLQQEQSKMTRADLAKQKKAADQKTKDEAVSAKAEERRRRTIARQVINENPGMSHTDMVPILKERLAAPVAPVEAPVAAEGAPVTEAPGAPVMITKAQRAALKDRGVADEVVAKMTPAEAHTMLAESPTAAPAKEQAGPAIPTPRGEVKQFTSNNAAQAYRRENGLNDSHAVIPLPNGLYEVSARIPYHKVDSDLSPEEVADLARQAGAYEPTDSINVLNKSSKSNGPSKPEDFPAKSLSIFKQLVRVSGNTAASVRKLATSGKMIMAPNAESIGRKDTGAAAYDKRTGKLYVYTDHLEKGNEVAGIIAAALHEGVHKGQFGEAREGRSTIMQSIMSQDKHSMAVTKIRAAAASGNKMAIETLRRAKASAADKDGNVNPAVEDLEVVPSFAEVVAEKKHGTSLGRLGSLSNDMLTAGREFIRGELGVDLKLSMGDLATATKHIAAEALKTTPTLKRDGGTLNMIYNSKSKGYDEAVKKGWVYESADGKAKYVLSDADARIKSDALAKLSNPNESIPLSEIMRHDILFNEVPSAKDVPVFMVDDGSLGNAFASYDPNDKSIWVTRSLVEGKSSVEFKAGLMHEVQHYVQDEGGMSHQFFDSNDKAELRNKNSELEAANKVNTKAARDVLDNIKTLSSGASASLKAKIMDTLFSTKLDDSKKAISISRLLKDEGAVPADRGHLLDRLEETRVKYNEIVADVNRIREKAHGKYLANITEREAFRTQYDVNTPEHIIRDRHNPEEEMRNQDNFGDGGDITGGRLDVPQNDGTVKAAGINSQPSDKIPDTLNMATREDTPRNVGESVHDWDSRIAEENVHPLMKSLHALFGVDEVREHGRQIMVGDWASRAREYGIAEAHIDKYKKMFDKMTEPERLQIIDDWENNRPINHPEAAAFFKEINYLFKDSIEYIQSIKPELLRNLKDNYIPHIYENATKNRGAFLTKGPLAGGKNFLKARQHKTVKDAINAGLKLKTSNPAELAMLKLAELQKFAGMLHIREQFDHEGYLMKNRVGKKPPKGWAVVNDPSYLGYVVPDVIAHDINNYLNRGLSDVPGFKQIREIENMMVGLKLGWSGFHLGFTTMDTMGTNAEVALRQAVDGNFKDALIGVMKTTISPVHSLYEGSAQRQSYMGVSPSTEKGLLGSQADRWAMIAGIDEHTNALNDLLMKGGMHVNMDSSEWNNAWAKQVQRFRQNEYKSMANPVNVLKAAADVSSAIIHRSVVPNQKMAAQTLLLKFELDRFARKLGKERGDYTGIIDAMNPRAAGQISRKVVELTSDRLGHMNYDTQFWNPYAKHVAQLTVMAPGWVVGTYRTVKGGLQDVARIVSPERINGPLDKAGTIHDATFGRLTSRTSNLIVLAGMTMAASGTLMYMLTGQWPESAKDYAHPKTGRKNADGTDERMSWPTYAKEHYAMLTHPIHEVVGKFNQPMLKMAWELIHNSDFNNTEIWNSHAAHNMKGREQQALQISKYIAGAFIPISYLNNDKSGKMDTINPDTTKTNQAMKVAGFFGVTPTGQEMDHSDAQNFINDKYFDTLGKGTRSQSDKAFSEQKAADRIALRQGKEVDMSPYNSKQRKDIISSSKVGAEEYTFTTRFAGIKNIEDKIEAWDKATPEERSKYGMKASLLKNAREQIAKIMDPDQKSAAQQRLNEIRASK